ncbi:HET-domain-containing protein [Sporormia fimetaria CBS 119925]|uniref:HET-domain-containing protein n=1 Tax=Sporormia fimetaria CBS 119925 TaxID=1340428 RepID=A0A6A6UXF7_9PLEO|nr:HET-domain-containing protein [Sporormia fimetaria CBS 119925]
MPFQLGILHAIRQALVWFYERAVVTTLKISVHFAGFLRPRFRYLPLQGNDLRVLKVYAPLTGQRDEPVRCSLEHVCMDEVTAEYKEWERETGHCSKSRPHTTRMAWVEHRNEIFEKENNRSPLTATRTQRKLHRYTWGDYVALSYCWGLGSGKHLRHIILNDRFIAVTENLEIALHTVRISNDIEFTMLWVDALCINQGDQEEKFFEIRRMKNIYGGAIGVFVHLGYADDDEEARLGRAVLQSIASKVADAIQRDRLDLLEHQVDATDKDQCRRMSALVKVLSRPYFRRLWILQELAMSEEASMMGYGHYKFRFSEVVMACKFVWHNLEWIVVMTGLSEDDYLNLNGCMWVIIFIQQLRTLSHQLEDASLGAGSLTYADFQTALNLSQNGLAMLPHDKVFGLTALLPSTVAENMKKFHDYRLPVKDVYIEFTKAMIEATGDLDVIFLKSPLQTMRPTWAVDWQFPVHKASLQHDWCNRGYRQFEKAYSNLQDMVTIGKRCRADASRNLGFKISNNTTLTVSAILIGTIDGIASHMPTTEQFSAFHPTLQPVYSNSPYEDEDAVRRALVHTLFANPKWGDQDPASLFQIPWILPQDYASMPLATTTLPEEMLDNIKRAAPLGWGFLFYYGIYSFFETVRRTLGPFLVAGKPFHEYFEHEIKEFDMRKDKIYLDVTVLVGGYVGRQLATLESGHLALAPMGIRRGDGVYVISGCSTPVALRKVTGGEEEGMFEVVGECYVDGFMEGEAMKGVDEGKYRIEEINLC